MKWLYKVLLNYNDLYYVIAANCAEAEKKAIRRAVGIKDHRTHHAELIEIITSAENVIV